MKRPFMIREAKLPAGYPPPGPVGEVVVKEYPASRVAVVRSRRTGVADSDLFRPLFNHIRNNDIAMTAPVVMDYHSGAAGAGRESMAFVYADTGVGRPGKDGVVDVEDVAATTVASVGVRGRYNDEHFRHGLDRLRQWLATDGRDYGPAGATRYLGYNSPLVPWLLRYGEVQLPVRRK
jgi:hypothetical protein